MSRLVVAIGHVEFTIANQTLYVVKVQQDADEWEVRRTYSDFRKLRDDIARVMRENRAIDACSQEFAAASSALPFPAKRLFGSRSDRVVRERAVELHQFLIKLLFLTHTYRKAQKQLYDPASGGAHTVAAPVPQSQQASASVFYLLRDFLKPVAAMSTTSGGSSANGNPHAQEDDESARRMIRESKMLSMRSSAHQHQTATKTMSAPNVLAYANGKSSSAEHHDDHFESNHSHSHANASANANANPHLHVQHSKSSAAMYRQQSSIPILEEVPPPAVHQSNSKSKTLNIVSLMSRSARTDSNASDRTNPLAYGSSVDRERNVSNASVSSYYSNSSRKQSSASESENHHHQQQQQQQEQPVLSSVQGRKVSSASASGSTASSSSYVGATSTPVSIASASSSTASSAVSSSAMYVHGSAPSSTSSGAASRAYPPSSNDSSTTTTTSQSHQHRQLAFYDSDELDLKKKKKKKHLSSSAHTVERRSKQSSSNGSSSTSGNKKLSSSSTAASSSSSRNKTRSASARDIRTSERKSKLSPQLTAQAVTINAQRELERYLSEYSAIMILRYVDRFINKAVMKAPGCYRVNAQRKLVIDSERFLEELEETFKDLPANFEGNFRNPLSNGDWYFPPALDAYVQMKWNSFQGHSAPSSSKSSSNIKSSGSRSRRSDSDDDSEDSEYEYEETISGGGGYMKAKKIFTDEEADVLDKMIAEGTAGRDQMLRLRRQMNEVGWNRRAHPTNGHNSSSTAHSNSSSHSSSKQKKNKAKTEYWTDTDDDDYRQTGSSGGEDQASVEHYQQKYNALRKERLSRREGGLV